MSISVYIDIYMCVWSCVYKLIKYICLVSVVYFVRRLFLPGLLYVLYGLRQAGAVGFLKKAGHQAGRNGHGAEDHLREEGPHVLQ